MEFVIEYLDENDQSNSSDASIVQLGSSSSDEKNYVEPEESM